MNTLGKSTNRNILPREESYALALTFNVDLVATPAGIPRGAHVTITGDKEVAVATAGDDFVIGHVTVGSKGVYDDPEITVQTIFSAEAYGEASGALTAGTLVGTTGMNTEGTKAVYVAAAAGAYAVGIVLEGAAAGAEVRVGILRMPVTAPTP